MKDLVICMWEETPRLTVKEREAVEMSGAYPAVKKCSRGKGTTAVQSLLHPLHCAALLTHVHRELSQVRVELPGAVEVSEARRAQWEGVTDNRSVPEEGKVIVSAIQAQSDVAVNPLVKPDMTRAMIPLRSL